MIKLFYKQEPYYYGHGYQAYDIQAEVNMNEDASVCDVIEATIRLLKTAGYSCRKQTFLNAIEDIFEDREEY